MLNQQEGGAVAYGDYSGQVVNRGSKEAGKPFCNYQSKNQIRQESLANNTSRGNFDEERNQSPTPPRLLISSTYTPALLKEITML